ncbi:hypothetical protein MPH_13456 [Macrophomina phaseolina MS6]|uniref:Zn(2)-C6 fungal-type domain-containing protein n=1 Tax=Macrophomina phaseolina (strain MS6) TaxID=1126212 RepID=K2QI69_MACPH|nr:hypothetical protein MPH_13456 [Macrophomina phaseolina MS6]
MSTGDTAQPSASAGKVAISALRPHTDPASSGNASRKERRIMKACNECKSKKIQCSGRKPTCDSCQQSQVPCSYAEEKLVRGKNVRLLQLLREPNVRTILLPHIQKELKALEIEVIDDDRSFSSTTTTTPTATTLSSSRKRDESPAIEYSEKRIRLDAMGDENNQEADVSADVGSEESVDLTAEDFNRNAESKATGFIGKHSETAWAQRLAHIQAEGAERAEGVEGHRGHIAHGEASMSEEAGANRIAAKKSRHASGNSWDDAILDYAYHLDDPNTLMLGHVERDELSPAELPNMLVRCYMDNVHDFFPILIKPEFSDQFGRFIYSGTPKKAPAIWRAILNLVFAIGAGYSHLIGAPWRGDDRDHLVYHTRALQLSPIDETTVALSDLQRVQVIGLVSFYYLTIGHVSRSWIMLGLACRQATALGLHLRPMAPSLSAASREKRARVWWSLYYLEFLLCEITGRPTMINHQFSSVPMPAPVDEEALASRSGNKLLEDWKNNQEGAEEPYRSRFLFDLDTASNPINHFRCRIQLAIVTQKIFTSLYSAATVSKAWLQAQEEITAFNQEVDQWYRTLLKKHQFTLKLDTGDGNFTQERIILGFCYYGAKMLLNRPCLCRIDERIRNQADQSKTLDNENARECVMAAKSMTDLLPDGDGQSPDVVWLYKNGPWWCIVHYLMQALTVLTLEFALDKYNKAQLEAHPGETTRKIGKIFHWLCAMAAKGNSVALAACEQSLVQFEGFKKHKGFDASELFQNIQRGKDILESGRNPQAQAHSQPRVSLDRSQQGLETKILQAQTEGEILELSIS